jgi:2-polyprenyl-3-methyl-5-hydroxy-6-metoxy-1,4-benzoquinol methylase
MPNASFHDGDVLEMDIEGVFDVVVLPDVIEHIPLEAHRGLFARVEGWLAPAGFALLHYPNPFYLTWCHEHRPELLQLVDQPVHADALAANVHASGLYLQHLETYSIWIEGGDYVVAVLRRANDQRSFREIQSEADSLPKRVLNRIRALVK